MNILTEAVEALYNIRCALEASKKTDSIVKMHLQYAESALKMGLTNTGLNVGVTSNDADQAKLAVLKIKDNNAQIVVERTVEKIKEVKIEVKVPTDHVQTCMEKAGDISGSQSVHKELGRFNEFVHRAIFCNPDESLMPDDPDLPVYEWIRKKCPDGIYTNDLYAMGNLYVEWTAEVGKIFLKNLRERKIDKPDNES